MTKEMIWPEWLPLRQDLRKLSPYGAPQLDLPVKLNTNENPYSLDQKMQQHLNAGIGRHLEFLNRYPDRDASELRSALAHFINSRSSTSFTSENIWVANGSNEILQSIALAFDGEALGFEPSYSMHPLICRVVGRAWNGVARNSDFSINMEKALSIINEGNVKIIFVTTPNNPTGTSIPLSQIEKLAEAAFIRNALVVVDEAYAEFSSTPSASTLIEKCPNIVVVRTMSKAFAFAGARVGYLIAQPEVVASMQLVRLPYHLSALTQAAALAALELATEMLANVERIIHSREKVAHALRTLGMTVAPSDSNFLLFSGFEAEAEEIWKELVEHGVLIRDVGIAGHLRVTIGTERENDRFIQALSKALDKNQNK